MSDKGPMDISSVQARAYSIGYVSEGSFSEGSFGSGAGVSEAAMSVGGCSEGACSEPAEAEALGFSFLGRGRQRGFWVFRSFGSFGSSTSAFFSSLPKPVTT